MNDTLKPVRMVGRIRDIDGDAVDIGVDYDTVTISGTVRLNRQQRRAFVKALAEATEAVAAYERALAEDTWAAHRGHADAEV